MPILNRYKEHEMAKERMTAIKNIRYLFESDEIENDHVMFCGLKDWGQKNSRTLSFKLFRTSVLSFATKGARASSNAKKDKNIQHGYGRFSKE